ncbi:pleckstrin homology domain-containing family N member 1 isoform X2 [Dasypus novemcinctus]|uniref:pleckstrin homology domain-containing family N member 1 isoform X2 n=1 Tax=Dasypus novemcinctus TaxID=9361 RepID=UPI00265E1A1E|nr:pleckstrin homology domain-containing family N member 1 isoform X2 [Dasypus novemcinctus]
MGNSHCVPQAPRRLRASFSRKPSLKGSRWGGRAGHRGSPPPSGSARWGWGPAVSPPSLVPREDSSRKLAGLFGTEAGPDAGAAADRILHYIPGSDLRGHQRENLDQPLLRVCKQGPWGAPVRNLGKVVHYAKVQLRFQHSQDISECYLELFPSHLYFQAHGSEGLTLQGLLPLTELSVSPLEGAREEHAFQITGPLPAPLLVLCPSKAELGCWLYHLEKQMALIGGLRHCHSAPPQGPPGDELSCILPRGPTQLRTVSGCEEVGRAICASRVKLQHLPSQEQHDRLLVLYLSSLAVFSEEPEGLCLKGELPLGAVRIHPEEKQGCSFLIEGPLIHTIRVLCASWEDCRHWLRCLRAVPLRGSSPESFLDQAHPGCASISQRRSELKRAGSGRSPRSKARGERPRPAPPLHLDLDLTKLSRLSLEGGRETPDDTPETPHSPLYADPYTPPATSRHKLTEVQGLEEFLSALRGSPGRGPLGAFPSVPVSVPVSDPSAGPPSPPDPGLLPKGAAQRHRGSCRGWRPQPPKSPPLVSPTTEGLPNPLPPPPGGGSPRRRRKGAGPERVWDRAAPPSPQKWPRLGAPEAEGQLSQWI